MLKSDSNYVGLISPEFQLLFALPLRCCYNIKSSLCLATASKGALSGFSQHINWFSTSAICFTTAWPTDSWTGSGSQHSAGVYPAEKSHLESSQVDCPPKKAATRLCRTMAFDKKKQNETCFKTLSFFLGTVHSWKKLSRSFAVQTSRNLCLSKTPSLSPTCRWNSLKMIPDSGRFWTIIPRANPS